MDFMISLFASEQTGKPKPRRRFSRSKSQQYDVEDVRERSTADATGLPPEEEEGNVEYKLKLIDPSPVRFEHLVTQLKWRLREGQGEAIYEIGVEDNGVLAGLTVREMDASLSTLRRMAHNLGASVTILRDREVIDEINAAGVRRSVAEILVRKVPENQDFIDLRVAVLGAADAGKSTLLGVITQGDLDNGRGRARLNLFRHLHEIQSGRTSSISLDLIGFDSEGQIITQQNHSIEEILEVSSKLVTFIDLCGHHKYLKTTIFGMTGYKPHFAMLVIAANTPIVDATTKEHLGLAMGLDVPVCLVITKLDLTTPVHLKRLISELKEALKGAGYNRLPVRIDSKNDAINKGLNFRQEKGLVPIFVLSSVTGENLDLLTAFLNVLPASQNLTEQESLMQQNVEFQIDEIFQLPTAGTVVAGLLTKGVVREGDTLYCGPTQTGEFYQVTVESIHRNKTSCRLVQAGQAAAIAFGDLKKNFVLRKGMVLLSDREQAKACTKFEADIYLSSHDGKDLCRKFQGTVHMGNIRQTARITSIDKPGQGLSLKDSGLVQMQFLKQPEFVTVGSRILFRQNKTKAFGCVTKVLD